MFNAETEIKRIVAWISEYFTGTNCNVIVGISGGKDSAVVSALCVEALGRERVIGVLMPNGVQKDIADSMAVVESLRITHKIVNIESITQAVFSALNEPISEAARINTPARIRMSVLYAISANQNGRVANTCNLSEEWVGYSTKFGDSAGDFSPLADYTATEVLQLGELLNLPVSIIKKPPEDGLSGKTDEESLGFTYAVLDRYIREGFCEDASIKSRINALHQQNLHKLNPIPKCPYTA